jgi:hypothetical protein
MLAAERRLVTARSCVVIPKPMQSGEECRGPSLAFVRLRQTKGCTQDDKLLIVFNGINGGRDLNTHRTNCEVPNANC